METIDRIEAAILRALPNAKLEFFTTMFAATFRVEASYNPWCLPHELRELADALEKELTQSVLPAAV